MNTYRFMSLLALVMLLAFLAPYIIKLSQWDITLVLLGGAALAIYDFIAHKD